VTPIWRKTLVRVRLHRLLADPETAGDELVREALEQEAEDLALPVGQRHERIGRRPGREQGARRARCARRAAGRGGADAVDHLGRGRAGERLSTP
jgi:hypothetical protein